jgi:signal transduction histidine kinase
MRSQLKEDRERRTGSSWGLHDLKTPLSVIQGYLEALDDGLANSEEKKERYLKIMRAKADLLEARIAHLIELAKTTTTEWRNSLEEADLGEFMEETLAPLAEYFAIRGYALERRQELEKRIVSFDRDMIARSSRTWWKTGAYRQALSDHRGRPDGQSCKLDNHPSGKRRSRNFR